MPGGARVGVGHVKFGFIRRETQTVRAASAARASKVIRHDRRACAIAVGGIESIDIIASRISGRPFGSAAVVVGVSEPDGAVGLHGHVVRRVKPQSIAGGHQRSDHAVDDHGNLLPGAAGFRADQPFLPIEQGAVKQRVRGREQEICDGAGRDEFPEPVVVLVAEHQVVAAFGTDPGRPFKPAVDRSVCGENCACIDDSAELRRIGDFERHRHRVCGSNTQENPREKGGRSLPDYSRDHALGDARNLLLARRFVPILLRQAFASAIPSIGGSEARGAPVLLIGLGHATATAHSLYRSREGGHSRD